MSDDYWTRKEKYDKLVEDSAVSWHKLYTEEKDKREELESRYNELTKILRKQGKDFVNKYYTRLESLAKESGEEWSTRYGHKEFEPEFGMMDDCYGDCDDKEGM